MLGGFYNLGTITVNAGATNFTTTGAALQTEGIMEGDTIFAGGVACPVLAITGQNAGTLAYPWPGAVNLAAAAYVVKEDSWLRYDPAITQSDVRKARRSLQNILAGSAFTFDTATADADPGAGMIRANNASLAAATELFICKEDALGNDISAFLAALDDSTNTSARGNALLARQSDGARFYFIAGVVTDAVDYIKLAISNPSGATAFNGGDAVNFQFSRAGDKGIGDLVSANNLSDVANATTARRNLYAAPFDAIGYLGMQVNGSADVSQENGTTQIILTNNTAAYAVDCWKCSYQNAAAVVKARQLAAASFPAALSGYSNAIELKATTALSSLANGDYAKHTHLVEGYRIARLGFGAASAQSLSYAFWFYNPGSAATIFSKVANSDLSRCYYTEHVVAAGWNFCTATVPGDTAGTWLVTTGIGAIIEIFSAGKAASPVAPGAWGATNTTQTTGSTQNLLGTANFAAVVTGLILLPGLELPSASRAPLIMRPYSHEITAAQRYFYSLAPGSSAAVAFGACFGTAAAFFTLTIPVPMRTNPTIASPDITKWSVYDEATAQAIATLSTGTPSSGLAQQINVAPTGTPWTIGRPALIYTPTSNGVLTFNSRL